MSALVGRLGSPVWVELQFFKLLVLFDIMYIDRITFVHYDQ